MFRVKTRNSERGTRNFLEALLLEALGGMALKVDFFRKLPKSRGRYSRKAFMRRISKNGT